MTITKGQRRKAIKVLKQLVEDAHHESSESGGMETIDDVQDYWTDLCKVLKVVNP